MKPMSDPETPDLARCGNDLLDRIDELTECVRERDYSSSKADGNGWRCLLVACRREIVRLRAELMGIADRIHNKERIRGGAV